MPSIMHIRRFTRRFEPVFAIFGVIAAALAIYQGINSLIVAGKSVDAAYKTAVLAQNASSFDLKALLKPEFSSHNKIVAVDVLIWNSGHDVISAADVRRPITVKFDKSASVLEMRQGIQKTALDDNYRFEKIDASSYRLSWKFLDPGDYFEAHFLVGTDFDRDRLGSLATIEAVLAGTSSVKMRNFLRQQVDRFDNSFLVAAITFGALAIGSVILVFGVLANTAFFKKFETTQLRTLPRRVIFASVIIPIVFSLGLLVAAQFGFSVVSKFYIIPGWYEPPWFPADFHMVKFQPIE